MAAGWPSVAIAPAETSPPSSPRWRSRQADRRFACRCLIYPVTDYSFETPSYTANAEGFLLTKASMEWFWGHYLEVQSHGEHPKASPLREPDLAGLPPAFVVTAEYDPLRDEGEAYANRLKECGVKVQAKRYDGQIHGFFANPVIDDGKDAALEAGRAIKSALA